MSEFECRHGDLMSCHDMYCPECEEEGRPFQRVFRMDGYTSKQLRMMEEYEPPYINDEDEENDDAE